MKKYLIAIALLAATPASANTIYTIDRVHDGISVTRSYVTGTITTDGTLGALAPENIVAWDMLLESGIISRNFVSHNTGSGGTWTPGSLTATPTTLDFDFGSMLSNSLLIDVINLFPSSCGISQCVAVYYGGAGFRTANEFWQIAYNGQPVSVPGPVVGAGLPGIIGLLGLWWGARSYK